MKTKIFTLLLAMVVSLCSLSAHDAKIGGIYYNLNSTDKTATVTFLGDYCDSYSNEYSGSVIIPTTVTKDNITYNVTSISSGAFYKCTNLNSIEIPNSITSIGSISFFGCTGLTTITIPRSVESIGDNAFVNCTNLTSVQWNAINCADFTTIASNQDVYGNWGLPFMPSITSFTFGDEVENIPAYLCYNMQNLTSVVLPNSVIRIGNQAFSNCTGLTSTNIPNSVTTIKENAFYNCSSLTSIKIPNSVISIGKQAFMYCAQLMSVIIGNGVTNIGEYAFSGGEKTLSVYCESATPALIKTNTFPTTSPIIYVPQCAYTTYQNVSIWKDMTIVPVQINMQVANNEGGVVVETCGSMEIEAIPFDGYHFKKWLDGNTDNPRAYSLQQTNLNFIAQFEINKYTITLNCDANQGSIIGDKGKYNYETDHTIEAVPNYGYHFTQWSDGETENPREFTLVQDTTFTALFAPNKYTLTIQYDNTYGSVEGEQGSFDYLSEHEIQVNAKYGYHFTEWSDGVTDNPRTLILTKDTTITASFAPNKYQLELIADANMGTINGEQGSFDYLSEHEITAVPNTGYLFSGWSDGATENPRTITLTRDTSITALFEHNLHTVTLLCDENQGSVSKSGDTHHSGSCTITATPNYGYHFTQWTDGDINNPRTFIVTQDTTFTAEFAVDKNGTCGDELVLTWTYDDEAKELTISGEGALNSNYTFGVEAPISVEKVIFDEGVTSVGNSAFANYTTLEEIHLATTIKRIYEQAFYNCENLVNIYCYRDVPCVVYNNTFDGIDKFSCTLHVPGASIEMYKAATGWRDFYYVDALPEHPTAIDNTSAESKAEKYVKNGQILILRGDKTYTLTGQEVK